MGIVGQIPSAAQILLQSHILNIVYAPLHRDGYNKSSIQLIVSQIRKKLLHAHGAHPASGLGEVPAAAPGGSAAPGAERARVIASERHALKAQASQASGGSRAASISARKVATKCSPRSATCTSHVHRFLTKPGEVKCAHQPKPSSSSLHCGRPGSTNVYGYCADKTFGPPGSLHA